MTWLTLLSWLNGGLLVGIFILAIHDQQNIAGLKRQHLRIKRLEAMHERGKLSTKHLQHSEAAFRAASEDG
jgi:hypothetical protein